MTEMCTAAANELIRLSNLRCSNSINNKMTPERLIALLYFCDVEHMKQNFGVSMFPDTFYTCADGILIAGIKEKHFPNDSDSAQIYSDEKEHTLLTSYQKDIIKDVFDRTKNIYTEKLTEDTKVKDGPWSKAYSKASEEKKKYPLVIFRRDIYEYYKDKQWSIPVELT